MATQTRGIVVILAVEKRDTDVESGVASRGGNAGLTSALGRRLAISEDYPELPSNQNFSRLRDELRY